MRSVSHESFEYHKGPHQFVLCVISPVLLCWQQCFSVRSWRGEEQVWGPLLPCWERRIGSVQLLSFHSPIVYPPATPQTHQINPEEWGQSWVSRQISSSGNTWSVRMKPRPNITNNLLWKPFQNYSLFQMGTFCLPAQTLSMLGSSSSISCTCFQIETFIQQSLSIWNS